MFHHTVVILSDHLFELEKLLSNHGQWSKSKFEVEKQLFGLEKHCRTMDNHFKTIECRLLTISLTVHRPSVLSQSQH